MASIPTATNSSAEYLPHVQLQATSPLFREIEMLINHKMCCIARAPAVTTARLEGRITIMRAPSRRHFMKTAGMGVAALTAAPRFWVPNPATKKPNVLFIAIDDLNHWVKRDSHH